MDYLKGVNRETSGRGPSEQGSISKASVSIFSKLEEIEKMMDLLTGQQRTIEDYVAMLAGPMPEMDNQKTSERLYDSAVLHDRLSLLAANMNNVGNRYERLVKYLSTTLSKNA